jgi:hypothetical protein
MRPNEAEGQIAKAAQRGCTCHSATCKSPAVACRPDGAGGRTPHKTGARVLIRNCFERRRRMEKRKEEKDTGPPCVCMDRDGGAARRRAPHFMQ